MCHLTTPGRCPGRGGPSPRRLRLRLLRPRRGGGGGGFSEASGRFRERDWVSQTAGGNVTVTVRLGVGLTSHLSCDKSPSSWDRAQDTEVLLEGLC